ncbi:hemicentin-2-like [Bacillus rossius redtenbacheri]|uniref:hemicentin-2-like n=1 Tax=Bacillus rossius redtenbacheri TaxID=93214 RepID=UPI002FDD8C38
MRNYAPHIESVGPDRLTTAQLYSRVELECRADGNPPPSYQWLQRVSAPDIALVPRGARPLLRIANVTYDHQGEYVCRAANVIAGTEHSAQSEAVSLQVVGAPQVLGRTSPDGEEVVVARGQDALLRLTVCADPRPRRAAWEWGGLQLEAGADLGRYQADELLQRPEREDCFEARLHVRQADKSDARSYRLAVENERGADRLAVRLVVQEPVPLTTLVAMAAGSVLLLLLAVWVTVLAARRDKCCFGRKANLRPSEVDREKGSLDGKKVARLDASSLRAADGAVASEAVYSTSPASRPLRTIAGSPDAVKVRLGGGAVPQPPTRV